MIFLAEVLQPLVPSKFWPARSAMSPDLVGDQVVIAVAHLLVAINRNFASYGVDDAQQRLSNLSVTARLYRRGVHLVYKPIAFWLHDDFGLMRRAFLRFVAEVDPDRSQKDEGENYA